MKQPITLLIVMLFGLLGLLNIVLPVLRLAFWYLAGALFCGLLLAAYLEMNGRLFYP